MMCVCVKLKPTDFRPVLAPVPQLQLQWAEAREAAAVSVHQQAPPLAPPYPAHGLKRQNQETQKKI